MDLHLALPVLGTLAVIVYLAGAVVMALLIRDGWNSRTTLEREKFLAEVNALGSRVPRLVIVAIIVLWPLAYTYALHRRDRRKGA